MGVTLKKCAQNGCDRRFPAHYFHDFCPEHSTPEDEQGARDRVGALYARHGEERLQVNALSVFLPADEGAALRAQLLHGPTT